MRNCPFVAGSTMIATVLKTGAGTKQLVEGDWVIPHKPGSEFGAWTSLTVVREKDLIKIPTDLMPLEYAAMHRELCVAYRLLEDHGDLKPGDAGESNCPVSRSSPRRLKINFHSILRSDSQRRHRRHRRRRHPAVRHAQAPRHRGGTPPRDRPGVGPGQGRETPQSARRRGGSRRNRQDGLRRAQDGCVSFYLPMGN